MELLKATVSCVLCLQVMCNVIKGRVMITHPKSYKLNEPVGRSISVECVSQDGANMQWIHKGWRVSKKGRYSVEQIQDLHHSQKSILKLRDVKEEDSGLITCMDASNHAQTDDIILRVTQANNSSEVKSKWRNKRDTYVRLKKKPTKSGQATDALVKSWKWYKYLTFMDPYISMRETVSNIDSEAEMDLDEEEDVNYTEIRSDVEKLSQQSPRSPTPPPSPAPSPAPTRKRTRVGSKTPKGKVPVVEIVELATESIRVVAGNSVTFKCINRDGKNLIWHRNGTPLHSNTHIIITQALSLDGTRINLLSPRHVSKADEGTYTCQEEGHPHNTDRVHVTVEEPTRGSGRGQSGEHFGQESKGHSDLHLSHLSHVITLCFLQILYFVFMSVI